MGSRVQSTVSRFPELCFLPFSVSQVLEGLRQQLKTTLFFPTWACDVGFITNNNNNNVYQPWGTVDPSNSLAAEMSFFHA